MSRLLETLAVGAQVFFVLSAIAFVVLMIWAGVRITDKNNECDAKGGILVKTGVDGYACIDRSAVK
jgi:hypothetical protein